MDPRLMAMLQQFAQSQNPQPTPQPNIEDLVNGGSQGQGIGGYGIPGWGTENGLQPEPPQPQQQQGNDLMDYLASIGGQVLDSVTHNGTQAGQAARGFLDQGNNRLSAAFHQAPQGSRRDQFLTQQGPVPEYDNGHHSALLANYMNRAVADHNAMEQAQVQMPQAPQVHRGQVRSF